MNINHIRKTAETYINNFIMQSIANDLGYDYEPKKDIKIKFTNHNYNNMHI